MSATMTTSLTELEREILDLVAVGLHERLRDIEDGFDVNWIASAMLDAIPTNHPFEDLGPFYDTTGVCRWLGITRQALHQKVKANHLLALTTGDGQRVYPAWQFSPDGRPVVGLVDLLRVLNPSAPDAWTTAVWLTRKVEQWGGRSAVDVMRSLRSTGARGAEWEDLLAEAREDAGRWAA